MRHVHERQHDDDADEDKVIDLTERLAPYATAAARPHPVGSHDDVVPSHAAILAALVDQAGAGRP